MVGEIVQLDCRPVERTLVSSLRNARSSLGAWIVSRAGHDGRNRRGSVTHIEATARSDGNGDPVVKEVSRMTKHKYSS